RTALSLDRAGSTRSGPTLPLNPPLTWTKTWTIYWVRKCQGFKGACAMRVAVSEAKGQLTELVKRAEAGDEVILTRRGHEIVRLVAVAPTPGLEGRRALMEKARASAAAKALPGPNAARSQDFLYGD